MKKINILWMILNLIFLVIFNVVFFTLGGKDHNPSVWISYGAIHLAYVLLIITPIFTRSGKSAALFGVSLGSISTVYFLVELATGIVFILIDAPEYQAALLVQLVIAGLYGILLVINMIANERTADAQESRQHQIDYVKNASAKLKRIIDKAEGKDIKKKLGKVYDVLHSSPVKSHPSLYQTESGILASIDELDYAVANGNTDAVVALAESLLGAVNERNTMLGSRN